MRTHDGYDARYSYEIAGDSMGENVCNGNDDIESNERRFQETLSKVASTMRSLIKTEEEHHQLNSYLIAEFYRLAAKDRFWKRYITTER